MKKIIIITTLFAFNLLANIAHSQTSLPLPKTVYNKTFIAELGGAGVLFSANFDSRFNAQDRLGFGYRLGLGFTTVDERNSSSFSYRTVSVPTIPFGINYLFGKPNSPNIFEVGAGATILTKKQSILNYNEYNAGNFLGHFEFQYRRQPVEGGFAWRIGFTPIINPDGDIVPFAGIGLGYSFSK